MTLRSVITALILALAFSPVLFWYGSRLDDGSGEPLGLIALALAIGFSRKHPHPASPRLAEISLILYALGLLFLPPLLRALPALATLAFLTGLHRQAGPLSLLFLSLPLQASLDFFLGYPLRLITAKATYFLVSFPIPGVQQIGVQLALNGHTVSVDPPCSGIQMLWTTAFLTALLASLFRSSFPQTLLLSITALSLCLSANILRAATLFFPEARLISIPGLAHDGIGILYFALAALVLIKLAHHLHHPQTRSTLIQTPPLSRRFLLWGSAAALITIIPTRIIPPPLEPLETLTHYRGIPVEAIPLTDQEIRFSKNFPGQLNLYRVQHDILIVRQVTKATRMLHPGHHCLRADGFSLTKPTLSYNEDGHPSLHYQATRHGAAFQVTERIRSQDGKRHWADVSAWYWQALFHPDSGPWIAETLLQPQP